MTTPGTAGIGTLDPNQNLNLQPARPPGQWNEFEIRVKGQTYTGV